MGQPLSMMTQCSSARTVHQSSLTKYAKPHESVDTTRNFGLTLNFDKGKTEALVSWGRKGRSLVLAHEAVKHHSLTILGHVQPLRLVSEYKDVGTWISSAASPQRDIAHKVTGTTTEYLQAVSTVFPKKQYTMELRLRAMQGLVESRLLSNAGGWADVTLLQMAKIESVRSRVLRKIVECFRGKETSMSDEKIKKMARVPPVFVLVMARRLQLAARICTACSICTSAARQISLETTGVVGSLPTARLHAGEAANTATPSC